MPGARLLQPKVSRAPYYWIFQKRRGWTWAFFRAGGTLITSGKEYFDSERDVRQVVKALTETTGETRVEVLSDGDKS
jgi:hypothetical protein